MAIGTLWGLLLVVGAMMSDGAVTESFLDVLRADGPAQDRAEKMMLYGQFVGDWEGDVVDYAADGSRRSSKGEVHFGWILEGRAIQDVWILPPRAERKPGDPATADNVYGTTIRVSWRLQDEVFLRRVR